MGSSLVFSGISICCEDEEIGLIVKDMVKVNEFIVMVIFILANGVMIIGMVIENVHSLKVVLMKVNGQMICIMEKVNFLGKMENHMMEIGLKIL
jgi:hypothetical protein